MLDIAALLGASLCAVLAYVSRNTLSPDGVSYLDLAIAVQHGDWSHFVQEYWSPLLPGILGVVGRVAGLERTALIPALHVLNLIGALGAIAAVWRWGRDRPSPLHGVLAISTVLMVSYGLPRMESTTPDLLLLGIVAWLSCELLRGGERWVLVGVLSGLSFLAKTSSWPWLLLAFPLRLWAARDGRARRRVALSSAVGLGLMALWIGPMSIEAGTLTAGSAGRLNLSWYLLRSRSSIPDRDAGPNRAYADIPVEGGGNITIATYDRTAPWTWQPWGDPTDWQRNVPRDDALVPSAAGIALFEWDQLRATAGWMVPLILVVILPACAWRRPRMWRELMNEHRDAVVVMLAGIAGIAQFVAVHSEPRLYAPSLIMATLGFLHWFLARESSGTTIRTTLVFAGFAGALISGVLRIDTVRRDARRDNAVAAGSKELRRRLMLEGDTLPAIGVVGEAAPLMSYAWRIGGRITVQVLPRSVGALSLLSETRQQELVQAIFNGKVRLVWSSRRGLGPDSSR